MFFLSNGILDDLKKKGQLIDETKTSSQNITDVSKILLKNYDNPAIVKVERITIDSKKSKIKLNLFDGTGDLDVSLSSFCWNHLSNDEYVKFFGEKNKNSVSDEKSLKVGSILILTEYFYEVSDLIGDPDSAFMLTVQNFSVIGFSEKLQSTKTNSRDCIVTIENLNTSLNNTKWSLKAKLLKISLEKDFVNKFNGQNGKYIRLQFTDETGIVEVASFNNEIEKVKNLSENRIYIINNADVKIPKSNYQAFEETSNAKIELIINKQTTIIESNEDVKLYKIFNKPEPSEIKNIVLKENIAPIKEGARDFLDLTDLLSKKDSEVVSVLGVVCSVEDIREISPKFKSPINLRNFYITDQSTEKIKVTLWGKQAETIDIKIGFFILLSKVKISIYQGICLSVQMSSSITRMEESSKHLKIVSELKSWWNNSNEEEISSSLKRSTTLTELDAKRLKE